jgi:hypothetical protein
MNFTFCFEIVDPGFSDYKVSVLTPVVMIDFLHFP